MGKLCLRRRQFREFFRRAIRLEEKAAYREVQTIEAASSPGEGSYGLALLRKPLKELASVQLKL